MLRPALDAGLNRAILLLAPAFAARPEAPATLPELLQARSLSPVLPVWEGASDATIFADPRVNHAFRAWHDAAHALGNGEAHPFAFTLAGEAAACEAQVRQLYTLFPSAPKRWATILRAEINAQGQYLADYGCFPEDQYAFTLAAIGETK